MHSESFTFGNTDMYEAFGVRVLHYDLVLPKLRRRKQVVPGRSGAFDYGVAFYDERTLRVECETRRGLTRGEMREMAYLLSKKNAIRFWNEPGLYYIGRVYDAGELRYLGSVGHAFALEFECDPFAYGEAVQVPIASGAALRLNYAGTAPTPVRLELVNTGVVSATVQIRLRERSEVY